MTTLTSLCAMPPIHALGWTLLHLCWQGTAIAALLGCVLQAMGKGRSRGRYAASCAALALIVAVPLGTLLHLAAAEYRQRVMVSGMVLVVDAGTTVEAGAGSWAERISLALNRALPWVLLLWCMGVSYFVARLSLGLRATRRMRRVGIRAVSDELQQIFERVRRRLEVTRAVRLVHSALVEVPTVVGWLRPFVLIPIGALAGMSSEQVEAILAHELAHIRRHDYLVSGMQAVVETVLFYHPAVWWISQQVRRERECCCDEMAVEVGGDVLAYARALSLLEERRSFYPEVALGANGGVLKMRIKRLLGCDGVSTSSQMAAIAVLTILAVGAAGAIATMARAESGAAKQEARVSSPSVQTPVVLAQVEAPAAPTTAPAMAMSTEPVKVASEAVAGMLLSKPAPIYPAKAKLAHVQGAVILHAFISKTGTIERPEVISGNSMLANAAVNAVQHWRYKPYMLNGEPVEVETSITVNFTLADDAEIGTANSSDKPKAIYMLKEDSPPPAAGNGIQGGPLKMSSGAAAGMLAAKPIAPIYPAEAKAAHVQGTVILHAIISKTGTIERLEVVSGNSMLTGAAMDAVQRWTYKPYLLNGEPVEVETSITVNFKLDDSPKTTEQSEGTDGVQQIGGADSNPLILYKVEPKYSEAARKAKVQGSVLIGLIVDKDGLPQNVHVTKALNDELDESAVEAVQQYKFKPAMKDGNPVAMALIVEVQFKIF